MGCYSLVLSQTMKPKTNHLVRKASYCPGGSDTHYIRLLSYVTNSHRINIGFHFLDEPFGCINIVICIRNDAIPRFQQLPDAVGIIGRHSLATSQEVQHSLAACIQGNQTILDDRRLRLTSDRNGLKKFDVYCYVGVCF